MFEKINQEKAIYERKSKIGLTITVIAFILFIPVGLSAGPIGAFLMMIPFMEELFILEINPKKLKK